ncbi:unnamed protein product [Cladocopium goreaui]|uniref:Uncharacterized protein n=1 Tax=Cladocopium goreaui TaxID=2562237 RepID=A0A9P1GRA5_9DINO|nr:unnamed protein product [Cladocopium goreaui]
MVRALKGLSHCYVDLACTECTNSRESRDTSREVSSESDTEQSGSDEACFLGPCWLLPDIPDSDEDFLLALVRQCTFASLIQFVNIPFFFFLARSGYTCAAYAAILVAMLVSGSYQFWLRDRLLIWLQQHKHWHAHIEKVKHLGSPSCIPGLSVGGLVFLRGIYETIDPSMDAFTAGNSHHMYTARVEEAFCASWQKTWLGPIASLLGLPGVLAVILCIATFCQIYKLFSESRRLKLRIEQNTNLSEAHRRWQIWIRMSHLTDVGGFMLLHHLFKELVLIEVSTSPDIWPIADRNAAFEVKIFAESVPSLWFQISLFCLTFSDASLKNGLLTLMSIGTSTFTILHFLYLQTFVMLQLQKIGELWQVKETALIISYIATLVCWALCMVRLPGAWICPSHILNVESGCLPKEGL